MRILITGGAGFIGSHIQDALIEQGHIVVVLDNLYRGKIENLNPKARFCQGDICDRETVERVFGEFKPEIIYHEAAQNDSRSSMRFPIFDAQVNILGTLNILESARKLGTQKIIYAASAGTVYGGVDSVNMPVTEDLPLENPSSAYGISKHTVEHYLRLYEQAYGLKWTALRYPNVYGPRQDGTLEAGVIAIFLTQMLAGIRPVIYGDGTQTRDYTYIKDVVRANLLALDQGDNGAFNIGTGVETSTQRVYDVLESKLKTGLKPIHAAERLGDAKRVLLDVAKAHNVLGWRATRNLEDGIEATIDHYRRVPQPWEKLLA